MADETPISFHFSGSTWRFRLATYVQSLRRPRVLLPIVVVALLPPALDRIVSLLVTGSAAFLSFLAVGLSAAAALVGLGACAAVLRGSPPTSVTFARGGIREETAGRVIEHPWEWIVDITDDGPTITLHCRQPMRSFRLASSAQARLLVLDKKSPGFDRLLVLLAVHRPASFAR